LYMPSRSVGTDGRGGESRSRYARRTYFGAASASTLSAGLRGRASPTYPARSRSTLALARLRDVRAQPRPLGRRLERGKRPAMACTQTVKYAHRTVGLQVYRPLKPASCSWPLLRLAG
jgi:hypothetical protein